MPVIMIRGYPVDLTVEQGHHIMAHAKYRLRDRINWDRLTQLRAQGENSEVLSRLYWPPSTNSIDIWYKGRWREVFRTDLKDNVGTGLCATKTIEAWVTYYRAKIRYGVRITASSFAVIDSFSDG